MYEVGCLWCVTKRVHSLFDLDAPCSQPRNNRGNRHQEQTEPRENSSSFSLPLQASRHQAHHALA